MASTSTEQKAFGGVCFKCQEVGHMARHCPTVVCRRCNEKGHYASTCQGPELRTCWHCGVQGHLFVDCPKKHWRKLRFTFSDEPPSPRSQALFGAGLDDPVPMDLVDPTPEEEERLYREIVRDMKKLNREFAAADKASAEREAQAAKENEGMPFVSYLQALSESTDDEGGVSILGPGNQSDDDSSKH